MIVIAIIGILAAIAIPNFISYRNKAFCSAAESDGANIANNLADYYAIPAHVNLETDLGALNVVLSGLNSGTITGTVNAIIISVVDSSSRCPADYQRSQANWGSNIFTTSM